MKQQDVHDLPCITLYQPWASLVADGIKTIETRLHNKFRDLKGKTIGIHAGKALEGAESFFYATEKYLSIETLGEIAEKVDNKTIERGYIIAVADVVDVRKLHVGNSQAACIDCGTVRRFGVFLDNIRRIKPIRIPGQRGIWLYSGPIVYKEQNSQ